MESLRWYLLSGYEFESLVLNDLAGSLGVEMCVLVGLGFRDLAGCRLSGVGVSDTGLAAEHSGGRRKAQPGSDYPYAFAQHGGRRGACDSG